MNVENISSAPDYIHKFINDNIDQLNKIYEEGMNCNDFGILLFQCSEKENKMDVQFFNNDMMLELLEKDSCVNLKNTINNSKKRLFMVKDIDINSIFLIYI